MPVPTEKAYSIIRRKPLKGKVPKRGLEPPLPEREPGPEPGASANSATSAARSQKRPGSSYRRAVCLVKFQPVAARHCWKKGSDPLIVKAVGPLFLIEPGRWSGCRSGHAGGG